MKNRSLIAVCLLVVLRVGANGIVWESPSRISLDSDVDNSLPLHSAINFGGSSLQINGVDFIADNGASDGKLYPDFVYEWVRYPFSKSYRELLRAGRYDSSFFILNDLAVGHYYKVQVWACDGRGEKLGRNTVLSDPSGNSVTLQQTVGSTPSDLGQYVLGYFTATSSSQIINISTTQESTLVNAVAVYRVSKPEPITLGLLSF